MESSISWNCCAVGAKPAVCVVGVVHTLKELNRPEIGHKTKQIFNNHFASTTEFFTVTECNVKVKIHVTSVLIKQMGFLRVILFDLVVER